MPTGSESAAPDQTVTTETGYAVQVEGVSVRYRVPHEKVSSFKEFAIRWFQRRVGYVDVWALREVSLCISPGEIFGIVGPNGAGKSTLLKVIARVLHPTGGRVLVRGKVAPLLELGAGFHPDLTGRENVYLYGTLLGRTRREMDQAFEDIVGFAELWKFIDAPLRTYSTGMAARLGFAVATARYADVILVDELLSVGDMQFQEKCIHRMDDYRARGATILFVSHDPLTINQICRRVAYLSEGRIARLGPASEVVEAYEQSMHWAP